jgi:pimeloyl-ACP methyl ester carboxylesterase
MKVYMVSGLGADHRAFRNIRLPEGFEAAPILWIQPLKQERLSDYASRLSVQIDDSKPFILMGLSLGGMIVSEMAKTLNPKAIILISSIPVSRELPPYFRLLGKLGIHAILPIGLIKTGARIKYFFTIRNRGIYRNINRMLNEQDSVFMKWAMDAILKWENEKIHTPILHIHGSRDLTLPMRYTHPTEVIPKAGHLLILKEPERINEIIGNWLNSHIR